MTTSSPTLARRAAAAVLATVIASLGAPLPAGAADTTPAAQLDRFVAQAGSPGDPARGGAFFTTTHGREWSCASCHGKQPVTPGRHASTGKSIDALAPAANPAAFTVTARVDKWLRRNCNDVLARECTAGEKADVIAWLLTLKP